MTASPNIINKTEKILNKKSHDLKGALDEICKLLKAEISYFDWVGFYFANHIKKELILKSYAGIKTDHVIIPFGKGVCGQVAVLNKNFIELTLAIDCLHEMDKPIIQYYLDCVNNFSKNFYFSVWEKTEVPYSKNIFKKENVLSYHAGDYNIPGSWENVLSENLEFPSNQIGLGFKIDN